MALFDSISSDNCVVHQGAAHVCHADAAITDRRLLVTRSEGANGTVSIVSTSVYTVQWRMVCSLTASYSYVGLTKAAAMGAVATLRGDYTKDVASYGMGSVYDSNTQSMKVLFVQVGSAPVCGATVTPVKEAGGMWRVDVEVAVEVEAYTSASDIMNGSGTAPTAPTQSDMEALVASFVSADANVALIATSSGGGSS